MTIENKIVTKPWRGNARGALVISIPKRIAENCQLTATSYVTIENENGLITIKKLEV